MACCRLFLVSVTSDRLGLYSFWAFLCLSSHHANELIYSQGLNYLPFGRASAHDSSHISEGVRQAFQTQCLNEQLITVYFPFTTTQLWPLILQLLEPDTCHQTQVPTGPSANTTCQPDHIPICPHPTLPTRSQWLEPLSSWPLRDGSHPRKQLEKPLCVSVLHCSMEIHSKGFPVASRSQGPRLILRVLYLQLRTMHSEHMCLRALCSPFSQPPVLFLQFA